MPITQIIDNKMPSITEWMEQINLPNIDEFRSEDNNKRDRLEVLYEVLGLAYDRPEKMTALDIVNQTEKFKDILKRKGDEKCALRLVPTISGLPKLRVRGKTLKENLVWFSQLKINPEDYKAEVIPHCDETLYSAIFVINDENVFGEITPAPHWELTQGIYNEGPVLFNFNFKNWNFNKKNDLDIQNIIKQAVEKLKINDENKISKLKNDLQSEFTKDNYLKGYFEFVVWPKIGTSFIDYNRILYKMLSNTKVSQDPNNTNLSGICASPGKINGIAKIINDPKIETITEKEILVCPMTMISYIPLMLKAKGIITDQGNILSHAGIVSRELKKPCIVGTKNATKTLKNGDKIEMNADTGEIKILN